VTTIRDLITDLEAQAAEHGYDTPVAVFHRNTLREELTVRHENRECGKTKKLFFGVIITGSTR
jgi:hypothetical protein